MSICCKRSFIVLITISLLGSCSLFRKMTPDNRSLKEKVESKDFVVSVTHSNPSNLRDSYLGNDVEFRMKNDSIFTNLPFFGTSNIIAMDPTEGGVNIETRMMNFVMEPRAQKGWNLGFNAYSRQYRYKFVVNIDGEGKVVILVTSKERTPMTYYGEVQ